MESIDMKKGWNTVIIILFVAAAIILPISCQRVFTFSPFSSLQRDPSDLSEEEQQRYALDALASGDAAAMAEAYDLIAAQLANDPDNGELHLLAADLAIGASGIGDLVGSIDPDSGFGDPDALGEGLDTDMLAQVDGHISQAEGAGETVSDSQYVNASAAIIFHKASENEDGFDGLDWENDEDLIRAKGYAENGGVDIESLFDGGEEETV